MRSTTSVKSFLLGLLVLAPSCTDAACDLSNMLPTDLGKGVTMQQGKDTAAGTYTMSLTYTDGQSWIGVGYNTEGKSKMAPATAVIGRLNENLSTFSVLDYSLISDEKDGSGVQPLADQSGLIDSTFTQSEDGSTSTLTFTHVLDESVINEQTAWIYAVGLAENEWIGKHKVHGSFQLLLEECTAVGDVVTPPVEEAETPPPVVKEEDADIDDDVTGADDDVTEADDDVTEADDDEEEDPEIVDVAIPMEDDDSVAEEEAEAELITSVSVGNSATACDFSNTTPIDLGKGVTMQHGKNTAAGTYTMSLTYADGQSWIGVGYNTEGTSKMAPATTVIGRLTEDESTFSVLDYSLTSDEKDASGVQPLADQSGLVHSTFAQADDGSSSTLTFTHVLDESVINEQTVWIYAVGLAENEWIGKHKVHGSLQLTLEECTVAEVVAPPAEEDMGVAEGADAGEEGGATTAETEDGDKGVVADGESDEGAVDTENVVSGLNENGGIVILNSGEHAERGLWMAHGIVLTLAWGVCAPLGIGASVLRKGLIQAGFTTPGLWYTLHYYLNMGTVLLTFVGFVLGYVATAKEGDKKHFDDVHHKMGLAIFLLVLIHAGLAYFRPGMGGKAAEPPAINKAESAVTAQPSLDKDEGSKQDSEDKDTAAAAADDDDDDNLPPPPPPKTMARLGWEYSHRLLGATLVALSWYNCHTGIEWQVDNWDNQRDWTGIFWGVTGGIAGSIFLLAVVVRPMCIETE